ncbi:MAG: hypothetical protein FJW34_16765 [Acidobacteria bacterium]|nr:hypothetical protein [Acidobacteriota bacterium]
MAHEAIPASRRQFLGAAGGALALGQPAGAPVALPKVKFGRHELTRLVIGSNPLYGYAHFNPILSQLMEEWMTPERRVQVLLQAERAGINTWQVHYNDPVVEDLKRYRDAGGKMNWLLLADFELQKNWKLLPLVAKLGAIGVAHHGNRTDERFRAGQMDIVRDFTKAVHDAGLPAGGVSCHNPAVVEYIEEHGWQIDYYMTCMYRVSRTREETRKELGEAPLGEVYMEKDPERMCRLVRQTKRTCFAFKLLGAGRSIGRPEQVEAAVRFVLTNIKPQDAVIVGMFPKFKDEIRENAELVRRISAAA